MNNKNYEISMSSRVLLPNINQKKHQSSSTLAPQATSSALSAHTNTTTSSNAYEPEPINIYAAKISLRTKRNKKDENKVSNKNNLNHFYFSNQNYFYDKFTLKEPLSLSYEFKGTEANYYGGKHVPPSTSSSSTSSAKFIKRIETTSSLNNKLRFLHNEKRSYTNLTGTNFKNFTTQHKFITLKSRNVLSNSIGDLKAQKLALHCDYCGTFNNEDMEKHQDCLSCKYKGKVCHNSLHHHPKSQRKSKHKEKQHEDKKGNDEEREVHSSQFDEERIRTAMSQCSSIYPFPNLQKQSIKPSSDKKNTNENNSKVNTDVSKRGNSSKVSSAGSTQTQLKLRLLKNKMDINQDIITSKLQQATDNLNFLNSLKNNQSSIKEVDEDVMPKLTLWLV